MHALLFTRSIIGASDSFGGYYCPCAASDLTDEEHSFCNKRNQCLHACDLPLAREESQTGAVGESSQCGISAEQLTMQEHGKGRKGETVHRKQQGAALHTLDFAVETCPTPGSPPGTAPPHPNLCKSHTLHRLTQPRQGAAVTET